jgi:methylglutaconyl-CoA hydratase
VETLQIEVDSRGVARIMMNRPERFNAFNELMISELTQAIGHCSADPAVRLIVLTGAGKAFSAGADLDWMRRASEATPDWNLADARRFADMLHALHSCPKPTIARVQGLALGGGVGLAVACDIALACSEAKFAVSEARFGILPAVIGPYVINAVGPRQARRLALTASRIDAQQALQIGLVHEIAELDLLDLTLERWIDELLANGPEAQAEIKALFAQLEVGPVSAEVRELSAQTIARVRCTDEAREGFAAFLAKRPPRWATKND